MRPLHGVAAAVVLITLDFRTTSVDLLPDLAGWLLVVWAAYRLAAPAIALVAGIGVVASVPLLSIPYHYVQFNPFTGETVVVTPETDLGYDDYSGWRLVAFLVSVVALAAVVALLAVRLRRRCPSAWHGPSVRRSIRRQVATTGGLILVWAVPRVVAAALAADDGYEPVWQDPAGRIALLGVVAAVAYATCLAIDAREPWANRRRDAAERVAS